jgi:hypothetical protein
LKKLIGLPLINSKLTGLFRNKVPTKCIDSGFIDQIENKVNSTVQVSREESLVVNNIIIPDYCSDFVFIESGSLSKKELDRYVVWVLENEYHLDLSEIKYNCQLVNGGVETWLFKEELMENLISELLTLGVVVNQVNNVTSFCAHILKLVDCVFIQLTKDDWSLSIWKGSHLALFRSFKRIAGEDIADLLSQELDFLLAELGTDLEVRGVLGKGQLPLHGLPIRINWEYLIDLQ